MRDPIVTLAILACAVDGAVMALVCLSESLACRRLGVSSLWWDRGFYAGCLLLLGAAMASVLLTTRRRA